MYIILAYDVVSGSQHHVSKCCSMYLHRIQRSLFEGELTEKQLIQLKTEIVKHIDPVSDTICIYTTDQPETIRRFETGNVSTLCANEVI